eukprot:13419223-Ditylum_brightwellii.AAC.1
MAFGYPPNWFQKSVAFFPLARRLQAYNPKVRYAYDSFLENFCVQHRILDRYHAVLIDNVSSVDNKDSILQRLDRQLEEGMHAAEKQCCKLHMGCVLYSPE